MIMQIKVAKTGVSYLKDYLLDSEENIDDTDIQIFNKIIFHLYGILTRVV